MIGELGAVDQQAPRPGRFGTRVLLQVAKQRVGELVAVVQKMDHNGQA